MTELIQRLLGISPAIQNKILYSIVIIIFFWILRRLISKLFINRIDSSNLKYTWNKYVSYFAAIISIILLISIWLGGFGALGTYLGLLSAGLAIALKDLLVNLSGWLFVITKKPFIIGDRIQINNIIGDVIDIRIFQFSLIEVGNWVDADQSTGRIIHIPNGKVFTEVQANYTLGFEYIWDEIPVLITFESDWKLAKTILIDVVQKDAINLSKDAEKQIKKAASKFLIHYKVLTPTVYTNVKDSGVLLTMRYLCKVKQRRVTQEKIWEDVLEQFAKYDSIDLAYPTQRFFNNITEGKPGASPKK